MSDVLEFTCRACGEARTLDQFRIFASKPKLLYMDFCSLCEQSEGTLTLYRRFHAYATPEIVAAVYAAERAPVERRTQEQVRLLVEPKQVKQVKTSADAIQVELARRELARRSLIYFTTLFFKDYKPGWVHQDIARRLEKFVKDVEEGKSPRLIICMPPRHGKSSLTSDSFISWAIGKHPEWGVIGASYNISLPAEFSRNIRDRIRDEEYTAIFDGVQLRQDSQSVESWKTTKGGGYIAAGVGVGISGKGYNIGVIDDPIKDYEAAQSETIRDATYAWYQSVFRLRAAPGAGILLIQTRWHDLDLAGRILSKEEELRKAGVPEVELDRWDVVSYPAIAEHDEHLLADGSIFTGSLPEEEMETARLLRRAGDALHSERYSLNALTTLRNTTDRQIWSALYQQNPTPDDGDFFKRSDFRYQHLHKDRWEGCRIFTCWDFAISKRTRRDWTVGGVFALTCDDELFLLEARRGRWSTNEIATNIVSVVETYHPEVFAGERGAIYEAIWPVTKALLDKKRLYVSVDETLVPIEDKETRARPLQARTQQHRLYFSYDGVKPGTYDDVERELLRFPNGTHDDCVDMLAWGARLSMNLSLPRRPAQAKKTESWKDKLKVKSETHPSHMAA
jgi:hypothetical protein